jgi:hypothetical protein
LRLANGLASTGFRGSQLAKTAIPTIAVLASAILAVAIWDDRSTVLQLLLGLVLAGLSVAAVLSNADSGKRVLAAFVTIVVLVGALFLVSTDWRLAPFVGTILAVLAAAVLAMLVLRRPRARARPVVTGP